MEGWEADEGLKKFKRFTKTLALDNSVPALKKAKKSVLLCFDGKIWISSDLVYKLKPYKLNECFNCLFVQLYKHLFPDDITEAVGYFWESLACEIA